MSDSETFLSRWLRLKRESEAAAPAADSTSATAFDPASLPPIESIAADSDIKQFLDERVPAELTRAALRSAWTADPAIRDFIGIAENQWDFNDHACMPGFGPLEAADYLMAQALGRPPDAAHPMPQAPEAAPETTREAAERQVVAEACDAVKPAPAPSVAQETIDAAMRGGAVATTAGETAAVLPATRTHGGALPQ